MNGYREGRKDRNKNAIQFLIQENWKAYLHSKTIAECQSAHNLLAGTKHLEEDMQK